MAVKKIALASALLASALTGGAAFSPPSPRVGNSAGTLTRTAFTSAVQLPPARSRSGGGGGCGGSSSSSSSSTTSLRDAPDLDVVALVAGQETYGFAVVAVGEALWSFLQSPSLDHAKVLVPAAVSFPILVFGAGPLVTSGDPSSVALGLGIATGVSIFLGVSYVARLTAPYSPSAKEIAFLGLLVSIAGFFSFSQNLVVNEFVTLPSLPSIPMPSFPSINFDEL